MFRYTAATPADVMIVATSHTATTIHAYGDDTSRTACGRTIGEHWTGEYDEGMGWGLPTCSRCLAHVTHAHMLLCKGARFAIGQTVGILVGVQSVDGAHIGRIGTVVQIMETWKGVTEYILTVAGERQTYREHLLAEIPASDDVARAASMAAHPAGKGRTLRIGGNYPHNVPVPVRFIGQDDADAILRDLLYGNPWNV